MEQERNHNFSFFINLNRNRKRKNSYGSKTLIMIPSLGASHEPEDSVPRGAHQLRQDLPRSGALPWRQVRYLLWPAQALGS